MFSLKDIDFQEKRFFENIWKFETFAREILR